MWPNSRFVMCSERRLATSSGPLSTPDGLFVCWVWAADSIRYHGNIPKRRQRLLLTAVPPSSWKIKQIQHPRVREAFKACTALALIFHGHLVLILVGIIDLERALPRSMKGCVENFYYRYLFFFSPFFFYVCCFLVVHHQINSSNYSLWFIEQATHPVV